MTRSTSLEITEVLELAPGVLDRVHGELTRTNLWLGNIDAIVRRLRRDTHPIEKVLDIGCGHGGVLSEIQRRLGFAVVGVDLNPPDPIRTSFPILRADATSDALPEADVAICCFVAHHMTEDQLIALIRNVGKSCRRLVILDLVRNRIPLLLFRWFVAPFLSNINAVDGILSIQRAYTPEEFRRTIERALRGTTACFEHQVSPLYIRQLADIRFGPR